jgi:hypothetical protein
LGRGERWRQPSRNLCPSSQLKLWVCFTSVIFLMTRVVGRWFSILMPLKCSEILVDMWQPLCQNSGLSYSRTVVKIWQKPNQLYAILGLPSNPSETDRTHDIITMGARHRATEKNEITDREQKQKLNILQKLGDCR